MSNFPNFNNPDLLETALTHRSALNEKISRSIESNERLEFLGDAVLELLTTNFLFEKFPQEPEGILTAYRSALVKTTTLAEVAQELGLGEKLMMSKGEEATGGRNNVGLLADSFEALLGAIYRDQGLEICKEFLEVNLFTKFKKIKEERLYKDSKSLLQEIVQGQGYETPQYRVITETGPDHDKEFTIEVLVGGKARGQGAGKSKQEAQQNAASQALEAFQ